MGETTGISWTDATFNPWIGCEKISTGCKNCYAAESTPARVSASKGLPLWGPGSTRQRTSAENWKRPRVWNRKAEKEGRRIKVFCASLADVFEDRADLDDMRIDLFDLIRQTPHLDWQLLTKRPQVILSTLRRLAEKLEATREGQTFSERANLATWLRLWFSGEHAPSNVWLGTTVEDQAAANARVHHLLDVPAVIHFLSVEPLIGPVDLTRCKMDDLHTINAHAGDIVQVDPDETRRGSPEVAAIIDRWMTRGFSGRIRWIIVGGESGADARPCATEWVGDVAFNAVVYRTPLWVKQFGARPLMRADTVDGRRIGRHPEDEWPAGTRFGGPDDGRNVNLRDKKGGDMAEFPEHLRVRMFPDPVA